MSTALVTQSSVIIAPAMVSTCFHQANPIEQGGLSVDCDTKRSVRSGTWVLAFDLPWRVACHVDMTFARCCPWKDAAANDGLQRRITSNINHDTLRILNLPLTQVGIVTINHHKSLSITIKWSHIFPKNHSCSMSPDTIDNVSPGLINIYDYWIIS